MLGVVHHVATTYLRIFHMKLFPRKEVLQIGLIEWFSIEWFNIIPIIMPLHKNISKNFAREVIDFSGKHSWSQHETSPCREWANIAIIWSSCLMLFLLKCDRKIITWNLDEWSLSSPQNPRREVDVISLTRWLGNQGILEKSMEG